MEVGSLRALPDGRWLLRRFGRRYVLPSELGRRVDAGEAPELDALFSMCADRTQRRSFGPRWKRTVLPGKIVVAAADRVQAAASWPALLALTTAGGLAIALLQANVRDGVVHPVVVGLLVAFCALAHEFGHATALIRGGGQPGDIGVGVMFVVPVLWCDVSEAALLVRRDRVRVDLAGVAWQIGAAGAAGAIVSVWNGPSAVLAVKAVLAAVAWSLLPLLRTDGAWVLADLVGLRDLEAPLPRDAGRRRRRAAAGVRIVAAIVLTLVTAALPWRLRGVAGLLWNGPPGVDAFATLALAAVAVVVSVALGRRVVGLLHLAARDLGCSSLWPARERPRP